MRIAALVLGWLLVVGGLSYAGLNAYLALDGHYRTTAAGSIRASRVLANAPTNVELEAADVEDRVQADLIRDLLLSAGAIVVGAGLVVWASRQRSQVVAAIAAIVILIGLGAAMMIHNASARTEAAEKRDGDGGSAKKYSVKYDGKTMEAWVEQIASSDVAERQGAVEKIAKIGAAAELAVPALVKALKDSSPDLRESAAKALGRIGPGAYKAVEPLLEVVKDKDAAVPLRAAAVEALGDIGDQTAVSALESHQDESAYVKTKVTAAIKKLKPPPAAPPRN